MAKKSVSAQALKQVAAPMSKARLENFSDGVFAVALTLLVLSIAPPKVPPNSGLAQYAAAMVPLVPRVISFVLSFVMVCIHWVNHHFFFGKLTRVTIAVVWLNNLLLLWICFLPLPTAMLGNNPTDEFPILLYALDSLLASLTLFALRAYAGRMALFEPEQAKLLGPKHSVPAIFFYSLSIILAFLNAYLALACLLIVPLLYFLPTLIPSRQS